MNQDLPSEQITPSSRGVLIAIAIIVGGYFLWLSTNAFASHGDLHQTEHPAETQADSEDQVEGETHVQEHGESHAHHDAHAELPPPAFFSVIPFVALLGAIALLPLSRKTEHWWEHNQNRFLVASGLGLVTLVYYSFLYGHGVEDHFSHGVSDSGVSAAVTVLKNAILVEYIPFISLLFSLYVISGGIHLKGTLVGKPKLNAGIIGLGGLLASFIGTTGAAMLLIRPLIRANEQRRYVAHTIIFFIFVVCNTGGCLLPIGDPPLFLGYLRGVDFLWTLNLWPMWLTMNLLLLASYYVWDRIRYKKELVAIVRPEPDCAPEPLGVDGGINFLWLVGVIFCVALLDPSRAVPGTEWKPPVFLREVLMMALTGLSLLTTQTETRQKNVFNYDAIVEVAALFIGIFICMQPPVQILNVYGPELGFDQAWKFFWGTGLLSSFLDNAPTYVVFFETAKTVANPDGATVAGVTALHLMGISLGAVFMGAMTYIGNGPNFMVKAIAEKNNIRMPSFFGYMIYSVMFVLPACVIVCSIFLRGK